MARTMPTQLVSACSPSASALTDSKPTSAIDPAAIPAAIATAPSTVIHASDSHESSFTRRASVP
jgi:hypothetical protein